MSKTKKNETKQNYPFPSKREILAKIETDAKTAVTSLLTIHELDAAMCSQKKAVEALAVEVTETGVKRAVEDEDLVERCRTVALRYGRRLAKEARAKAIEKNPELAELAEKFGANV